MNQGTFLDLNQWSRRASFDFFVQYEQPFFSLCAEVPVSATLAWCKERGESFSLACWYVCQRAANLVEPFRYRLRDEGVWVHDQIRVATTALYPDESFRFCHLPHAESFASFAEQAAAVLAAPPGESMDDRPHDDALIHGSSLPWIRFTSITHPRRPSSHGSIPKVVFGRYGERDGEVRMPVAVEVHHALMDGLHVARFLQQLERDLATPGEVLADLPRQSLSSHGQREECD